MPSKPERRGTSCLRQKPRWFGYVAALGAIYLLSVLTPVARGTDHPPAQPDSNNSEEPQIESELWWRQQAVIHIDQIEDEDTLGRAINDFNYVRVRAGDLEGASAAAPRIGNSQLRVFAHLFIAKHYKLRGDMDACLAELARARPVALADQGRYQMIDAYLDYADSIEMATTFVTAIEDPMQRKFRSRFLADGLARRGRLDDGLEFVNNHLTSERQQTLATMARASGSNAHSRQVAKLTAMLTDIKHRDAAWKTLIDRLAREGRQEEAGQYVERISDKVLRAQANAAIDQVNGLAVAKISAEAIQQQIRDAATREEKKVLQDVLLKKMLDDKNTVAAEQVIESMVETIQAFPRDPQVSKFGTLDDNTAIAIARSNYLTIATLLAQKGDLDAGREALAKGRQAVLDMPDSSGLGKMLVVPKLVQAQSVLGDQEGARETLRSIKPIYSRMVSGAAAVSCIRSGDVKTGLEMATMIMSSGRAGRQIGEIAAELVRSGESKAARELLSRVGDGRQDIDAFREFGSCMITLGRGPELNSWLSDLSTAARAYACIGAARTLAKRVGRPPASAEERAVVEYLTIPPKTLPDGFSIDHAHVPPDSTTAANPGVFLKHTLLTAVEHFQSHRRGKYVQIENAYRAIYRNDELGGDVVIEGFVFPDADTASQVRDQIYVRGFVDRYYQKGRMLFYVSLRGQQIESARGTIQAYLEKQELPEME